MLQIILASQSPRRRELIQLLEYPVTSMAAYADEDSVTDPDPAVNVVRTAQLKMDEIVARLWKNTVDERLVIAADTTVALDGQMLNKPADAEAARQMLQALRDCTHQVHTGVVLHHLPSGRRVAGTHTAVVTMRDYTDAEIDAYVATGDPLDKAGAYAIQHPHFRPVARLDGCFMGVMGLSICHVLQLTDQIGTPLRADLAQIEAAHRQWIPCPVFAGV